MAEKTQAKATARKVKDKWKSKSWYTVIAPDMFNRMKLAETFVDEPEKMLGRIIEVTVQELNGDFAKTHIKILFKINRIAGTEAHTEFVGHDLTSDYIRRMTRRKRSKADVTVDVITKDEYHIRIKPMAISERRIQGSQKTAIRNNMKVNLTEWAKGVTMDEYVKSIISGDLLRELSKACKPIQPMNRVEIRKSEVMKVGIVPEIKPGPGEVPSTDRGAPSEPTPGVSPEPSPGTTPEPSPQ
jgi:small subunit ribosomal protein S3Ae